MSKIKFFLFVILSSLWGCVSGNVNGTSQEEKGAIDSLYYPIDSIPSNGNKVHICKSEDGNMKFYSWDTGMGGTSPSYAVLCQFRTKDGKSSIEDFCIKEDEEPAWVSKVHSIKRNDGTTYYIIARSFRASSNDGYMYMDALVIDNDTLKNVSVLDGSDDLDECGMEINYSISDWYYATNGDGWDWLFEYDSRTKDLYVPIIAHTKESCPVVSDRYKLYHFNGKEFFYKGESPHKGLYASLSNYKRLVKYFRTKNYIVRVDEMEGGACRYASWKSSSAMSEMPELVILGGKYDEKEDSYTFVNDGVEYIVGYIEDKPISDGSFEHHEFLLVKKGGKILLKEERIANTD